MPQTRRNRSRRDRKFGIEYVGLDGKVVGLHQFGMSAPGPEVMKERGIDAQHVIEAAKRLLGSSAILESARVSRAGFGVASKQSFCISIMSRD